MGKNVPGMDFTIHANLSAAEAFRRLTAWADHEMPFTTIEVTEGDGGLGTKFVARTELLGQGFDDRMEVTHYQPPTETEPGHCVVTKYGPVLFGYADIAVLHNGPQRCAVRWQEKLWVGNGVVSDVAARVAASIGPAVFKPLAKRLLTDRA